MQRHLDPAYVYLQQDLSDRSTTADAAIDSDDGLPLHLLRLVSPSFPVGAFSYSRGLEWAVQAGWVHDAVTARDWILGNLEHTVAAVDGALFWRMSQALQRGDDASFTEANAWLGASRESRELQLEDRRMGAALLALLADLGLREAERLAAVIEPTYPAAFAIAAGCWKVTPAAALKGLLWSIVDAQVAAAIRLVPLGFVDGQRVLIDAVAVVARSATRARTLQDSEIGNLSPALAMASAWHETQYSRLFRS